MLVQVMQSPASPLLSYFTGMIDLISYGAPTNLYVYVKTILSQEGTERTGPLAMSVSALALLLLMDLLEGTDVTQKRCADYGNAVGRFK